MTAAGLASAPIEDWSGELDAAVERAMAEYGVRGVSLAVIDGYRVVKHLTKCAGRNSSTGSMPSMTRDESRRKPHRGHRL